MGTLCFTCPASGREVDTGIELDLASFESLRAEQLGCPDCLGVHRLVELKAWVRQGPKVEPDAQASSLDAA
jgi:hypothetical protein